MDSLVGQSSEGPGGVGRSHTQPASGTPVHHIPGSGGGSIDDRGPGGNHGRGFHAPSKLNFFRRHFCTAILFLSHPSRKLTGLKAFFFSPDSFVCYGVLPVDPVEELEVTPVHRKPGLVRCDLISSALTSLVYSSAYLLFICKPVEQEFTISNKSLFV